jgi:hypothetical protein
MRYTPRRGGSNQHIARQSAQTQFAAGYETLNTNQAASGQTPEAAPDRPGESAHRHPLASIVD